MRLLKDIAHLLFPQVCACCGERLAEQEERVCSACLLSLPRTNSHMHPDTKLDRLFLGGFDVVKAVSFFYYVGEANIKLIYDTKYHGMPDVGRYLATAYSHELLPSGFFDDIDLIIPVPLHWKRRLKRGYNQSFHIAKGVSDVAHIPICTNALKRQKNNRSQTTHSRHERQENVKDIFCLKRPELIEGKHILLVDDVITTGATLIACGKELMKAKGVRVSVLTLALAGRPALPMMENADYDPLRFGVPLVE